MGSIDSLPAAFELAVVEGREQLSFQAPPGSRVAFPTGTDWGGIEALVLEIPDHEPAAPPSRPVDPDTQAPPLVSRFQNRRLKLRAASLVTSVSGLQAVLDACPLAEAGIHELRLWVDPYGPRLRGRVTIGSSASAFTVRVAVHAAAANEARSLQIGFADLRLFAPLPVAGPVVGAMLAGGIAAGLARAGVIARAKGGSVRIDPLETAAIATLVSQGWRLPDLAATRWLTGHHAEGDIQMRFGAGDRPPDDPDGGWPKSQTAPLALLEGEWLPAALASAEERLVAGDLAGCERECRRYLADDPDNRAVWARLLSLRAAVGGPDLSDIAATMMSRWPDFLPAFLAAAVAALGEGDVPRAVDLYGRAAMLAEARGEFEDAALARAAATAAAGAAEGKVAEWHDPESAIPRPVTPGQPSSVTGQTAAVYAEQDDPDTRAEALGALLQGFERLTPERQHDAYASFGRVAEATGDMEHAEEAYWRASSVAVDAIRRADDLVAHARVSLARGNLPAAVADLEEAATLDPGNVDSRQALAGFALERGDLARAARLLEEVVRGLPLDAIEARLETRQRLAEIHSGLADWAAARAHVELVLTEQPGNIPLLERLQEIYEQLGLHPAAVDVLGRLARLYGEPRRRAEALMRQGDILHQHMGDESRAFDAYLKSSDSDARFEPTGLRLIAGYWTRGQFAEVAALADDLLRGGPLPDMDVSLRLRLAMAIALARGDAARGAAVAELTGTPWDADAAAAILAEASAHFSARPPGELEPARALLEIWRTMQNAG